MAQHFGLSATSRILPLKEIYNAGEDAAYGYFCKLGWLETNGQAVCPRCGHDEPMTFQPAVSSSVRLVITNFR